MNKKTTYSDGRVEEISGTPSEIAEYELRIKDSSVAVPGIVGDECEKWRRMLEEGLRRGPECDTMWLDSLPRSMQVVCGAGIPQNIISFSVPGSVAAFFEKARAAGHDWLHAAGDPESIAIVDELRKT